MSDRKFSKEQREILIGMLLGDAHLETSSNGKTYRLKVEQSIKHKEYVGNLFEIFKEWVTSPPKERVSVRGGKESRKIWFQTESVGELRFYGQLFYREKKKVVPKLIHRWLTPRALAFWYMDDGSIKSKQSKAVVLNTQGFSLNEVEKLCDVLSSKLGLDSKPRRQRDGWQIYISGRSYERFRELVNPFIHSSMMYKIPPSRLT